MRFITKHIYEMVIGALLLALGLLYLSTQRDSIHRLVNVVKGDLIEQRDLYQQASQFDQNKVTDEHLYALLMGYREYPIVINGNEIPVDGSDYEFYFSLITQNTYTKSYVYDSGHNIIKVVFNESGT